MGSGGSDGVPALLDIGLVGGLEPLGQADDAVFELRALEVADAVERREFARRELADAFDDSFHEIGLGMGEAFGRGQLRNPGIDADGEELVAVGGVKVVTSEESLRMEMAAALGRAGKRI